MEDFKVGDTVTLNSGGPIMTVSKVYNSHFVGESNVITCVWHGENNTIQTYQFKDVMLTPIPAPSKVVSLG